MIRQGSQHCAKISGLREIAVGHARIGPCSLAVMQSNSLGTAAPCEIATSASPGSSSTGVCNLARLRYLSRSSMSTSQPRSKKRQGGRPCISHSRFLRSIRHASYRFCFLSSPHRVILFLYIFTLPKLARWIHESQTMRHPHVALNLCCTARILMASLRLRFWFLYSSVITERYKFHSQGVWDILLFMLCDDISLALCFEAYHLWEVMALFYVFLVATA